MYIKPTLFTKAFASPMRYYQGPDASKKIVPQVVSSLGSKPFIFGGCNALNKLEQNHLYKAIETKKLEYTIEEFGRDQVYGKECCDEEVNRLSKISEKHDCDIIISAGGGKAIDAGKAVGDKLKLPMISLPTVASTDAPTSSLSVIYTKEHRFKEYRFYNKSPDAVIVDSKIIAEAPARYLACGIGDAFSKKFEVESCYKAGKDNQIVKPASGFSPLLSVNLANYLYDILEMWGREAMLDAKNNLVSSALEAVIEGNILLSGLAFESGGLAAAHSIYDGLTVIEDKMNPHQYHGELVHFGTCVQVVLEGQPHNVIHEVFKFGHDIGLPETFEEIGLKDFTEEDLWKVAEKATSEGETIHKMDLEITPEKVYYAMKSADRIGRTISKRIPRALY
jgi:glycerol dehydrogenase